MPKNIINQIEDWLIALTEMLVAGTSLAIFFQHIVTIVWAIVTTVVIFFVNKFLKKMFP